MSRWLTDRASTAEESVVSQGDSSSVVGMWLIVLCIAFEYIRPQSLIPGLGALHVPMILRLLIVAMLFMRGLDGLKSAEAVLFASLVCFMALLIPVAENHYWAYHTTKDTVSHFIVFLGIIGFLRNYRRINLVLTFWIIVAVISALRGSTGARGVLGSPLLEDENDFCLFLNMMIPLAFFKGYTATRRRNKALYYLAVVALVVGCVASNSRGGFVGLVVVLLYCWWRSAKRIRVALAAGLIGLVLVAYTIPDTYWKEMKSITEEGASEGTAAIRIYLWQRGWDMFLDHPLFGVGPGNYPWNIKDYEPYGGYQGKSEAGRVVHSIYFTLLPELGLVGVCLYLGMLWTNRRKASRLRKLKALVYERDGGRSVDAWNDIERLGAIELGLAGAMIAYFITGTFLSALYYANFWTVLAFSVADNGVTSNLLRSVDEEAFSPSEAISGRQALAYSPTEN